MVILHSPLPRSRPGSATTPRSAHPADAGLARPALTLVPDVPEAAEDSLDDPAGAGAAAVSPARGALTRRGLLARRPWAPRLRTIDRGRQALREAGMATAEYAIATLAAVGFAGLLLVILRSGEVRALLMGLVKRALSVSS